MKLRPRPLVVRHSLRLRRVHLVLMDGGATFTEIEHVVTKRSAERAKVVHKKRYTILIAVTRVRGDVGNVGSFRCDTLARAF